MTQAHGAQTPEEAPDEPARGTFAERLDFLCRNDPRGPFSNPQVVQMLEDRGLPSFSGTYMWQLRTGKANNPTLRMMDSLADLFGVPRDYWLNAATAQSVNALIIKLNELKVSGATPDALHRQLAKFTQKMAEGTAPEALAAQLDELARLSRHGVSAETLKSLQDQRVSSIAMRSVGLSDAGLSTVKSFIENFRLAEGLPAELHTPTEGDPGAT
ncbi:hypothetical protein G3I60_04895 [Streptomyces sp. SID13666]|uniref:hypothetical protein n=1 Tax=Streptomyces sp. SID13666 TaxID=2706054 RepID=UPI0013C068AF|nr:hypothetical protein [Streptomyces sp. SID13666]NEA53506.1 hypothetical protein [Streptomyces sp. SID13666]